MQTHRSAHTSSHLCQHAMLILLYSVVVTTTDKLPVNWTEAVPTYNTIRTPIPPECSNTCDYDAFFHRAQCNNRNLHLVPLPSGCEEATILELYENHIPHIDEATLQGFRKVKTLDISSNQISYLQPGSFKTMSHMINLLLSQNRLTQIQNGSFLGTENYLQRLYVDENRISEISGGAFFGLSTLQYLRLSANELNFIAPETLGGLANLQQLFFDNNKLTSLPTGFFFGLESLRVVNLSHNNFVSIPSPELLGLGPLQELDIQANNMTKSYSLLPYLDIVQRINIDENYFIFDCDFVVVCLWFYNQSETDPTQNELRIPLQCDEYSIGDDVQYRCESTTTEAHLSVNESSSSSTTSFTIRNSPTNKLPDFNTEFISYLPQIRNVLVYCAVIGTLIFILLLLRQACDVLGKTRMPGNRWEGLCARTATTSVKTEGTFIGDRDTPVLPTFFPGETREDSPADTTYL